MGNYDDYQLDEMENAAVDKSRNLKRGLVAGAAVLGVGGTAAFGATKIAGTQMDSEEASELTQEDLLAGADAAVETPDAQQPVQTTENVHVYIHEAETAATEPDEIDLNVEESAILYDEDGYIVGTYDAGKIDGRDFVVIDNDLNGKGDVLAYDANGNGLFEENEIVTIDNRTYDMGQGKEFNIYAQNGSGDFVKINEAPVFTAQRDDLADIHNDFEDEKTGEYYRGDLAENNRDYINDGAEQYSAGMDHTEGDVYAEVDSKYDGSEAYGGNNGISDTANDNYAYEEPGYGATGEYDCDAAGDMAYGEPSGSFDDPEFYDA